MASPDRTLQFVLMPPRQFGAYHPDVLARLPDRLGSKSLYWTTFDPYDFSKRLVDPRQIEVVHVSLDYSLDTPFDYQRPIERARLHLLGQHETLTVELSLWKADKSYTDPTQKPYTKWAYHLSVGFTFSRLPPLAKKLYLPVLELEPCGYELRQSKFPTYGHLLLRTTTEPSPLVNWIFGTIFVLSSVVSLYAVAQPSSKSKPDS